MSTYQDYCLTKLDESKFKTKFFGNKQGTDTTQSTRNQSTEIQGNTNPFCIHSRYVDKNTSVPNPFATQQRPESKSGSSQSLDRNNGFFSSNMNMLNMPRDNYNPNSNSTQNFVGKSNPFNQNSVVNTSRAPQNFDPNSHTYTNSGQAYRKGQFQQPQKNSVQNQQQNGPHFSVPSIINNNGFTNNHNNNNSNKAISPVSPASGSAQPSSITGLFNNPMQNQRYGGFNTNFGNITSSQNMQKNNGNQFLSIPRKSINNFQQPKQQSRLIFQQQGQKRQLVISGQNTNSPNLEQSYPQPPFPQIKNIPFAADIKNNQNSTQTMAQNAKVINDAPNFNLAEYNKLKQQLEGVVNLALLPLAQAYSQKKKQREQENQRLFQQYLLQEEQKAREYRPVWFDDNSDGLFTSKRARRKQEQERRIIINVVQVKKQSMMRQRYQREQYIKNFHHNYQKNQQKLQNISKFPDNIFNFDLHQEHKIKNVKKQKKDETNNFEHIQVSQFPDSWKLEYSADLRWLEEPNIIRKTFDKAYVYVSERPSRKEIEEAILLDLRSKGVCIRQNFIYKENDFDFKRYKPNFLMKYLFGRKQREFKEFVVSCTIFQRKINLPSSYKCNLPIFKGFTVKDLEISNQYGSITWEGQTKIYNIQFSKGIKISKDEVDCQIAELEKQAIVEFYSLPIQTQGKSIVKIQRQLQKLARGAEVISVDMDNKSWKLKVNLGRQQR